jgi:hypothetical protein
MIGCTTGAKLLRAGHEFILFKNRDFGRKHYDDHISLTDHTFGAIGLETWDGADPDKDRLSGFSIGFNAGLACCDSNVRTVEGGDNYDKLVQAVVEGCTTLDQAEECVRDLVRDQLFCWANMVVATREGTAAIEIRDHHVEVERNPIFVARSNHHICLGATAQDDDTTTTAPRYHTAFKGLQTARNVEDIFALLRSHEPDQQHSVCNHGLYDTVYSYVVHWNEGVATFYVAQGHPCTGEYVSIPIILGGDNDLSRYPSRYAIRPAA